jgi:hypothetical protein
LLSRSGIQPIPIAGDLVASGDLLFGEADLPPRSRGFFPQADWVA